MPDKKKSPGRVMQGRRLGAVIKKCFEERKDNMPLSQRKKLSKEDVPLAQRRKRKK